MPERYKIEVRPSTSPEWEWTAYLLRWDGTGWMTEAGEDGDTREEAIAELRASNRQARNLEVV